MVGGEGPVVVAKPFSKYVNPKDLLVWARDYERLSELLLASSSPSSFR